MDAIPRRARVIFPGRRRSPFYFTRTAGILGRPRAENPSPGIVEVPNAGEHRGYVMGLERSRVAPGVAAALAGGQAVVALESTLIAQGLPWPRNLEAARAAEAEVRCAG